MAPILDLHWTDGVWTGPASQCDDYMALCQKPMPDSPHATSFWASVADTFKRDHSVIFDLFNEPFVSNIHRMSTEQSWKCWRDGGASCPGVPYQVAGMQQLVDAVRGAGAHNVILLTANSYGQDLEGYAAHRPHDPDRNLAVAWHWYNAGCRDAGCWSDQLGSVGATPVIASEVGEFDCSSKAVAPLMSFLDARRISYLAWTWNVWDCRSGPALISDYAGDPTGFGAGVRSHLQGR
jgi:endoglucanase